MVLRLGILLHNAVNMNLAAMQICKIVSKLCSGCKKDLQVEEGYKKSKSAIRAYTVTKHSGDLRMCMLLPLVYVKTVEPQYPRPLFTGLCTTLRWLLLHAAVGLFSNKQRSLKRMILCLSV